MNTFYIVDLESLDNRYTKQWKTWFPTISEKHLGDQFNVVNIAGQVDGYAKPQPGAFFNFFGTCEYKASQGVAIAKLFADGKVKNGDYFFFTDAWNQTAHYVRYMAELSDIKVHMGGIWHAGWYDPTDILGVTIKNKAWAKDFERSVYHAFDQNFFGTTHNKNLFIESLDLGTTEAQYQKCYSPGVYPFEWIADLKNNVSKQDIVVFPHRINYDKAPWIFDELKEAVQLTHPHIEFAKTQERNLSKEEYYEFLKTCKVIFSANKHENLGIGTFEAMSAGCLPVVPNKLSYKEIYSDMFKYEVGDDFYTNFERYKPALVAKIIDFVTNYNSYSKTALALTTEIQDTYFSGTNMFTEIRKFVAMN